MLCIMAVMAGSNEKKHHSCEKKNDNAFPFVDIHIMVTFLDNVAASNDLPISYRVTRSKNIGKLLPSGFENVLK